LEKDLNTTNLPELAKKHQPPITTKTIFNGQTLLTTTDVLVDLEIGDDLEVAVDIEIGGNQRERPTP